MMKFKVILIAMLFSTIAIYPKVPINKSFDYKIESSLNVGAGENAPFWLIANRHGVASLQDINGYLRASMSQVDTKTSDWGYSWSADIIGGVNFYNKVYIQQLFFDVRYSFLKLELGMKERNPELRNSYLSSGALTLSNNARPIPQIRIGTDGYFTIPRTKDFFHVKGHVSYGMFVDNNFQRDFTRDLTVVPPKSKIGTRVENALYHSKSVYVKLGNVKKYNFDFEGGLEMASRFGGHIFLSDGTSFYAPHKFSDFLRILVPLKGGDDSHVMDQQNVLGDHLGSWNFRINYKVKDWRFALYYEHQFNDHSQLFGEYGWKDGMWGVEVKLPKNRFLDCFVFERIESRHQSGPIYYDATPSFDEQISSLDDYYNHGMYSGWQHHGLAIANPLFISPIYNETNRLHFASNRIVANHLGFSGQPSKYLRYRILCSISDHWGTYYQPYQEIKYNHNYLFELISYLPKNPTWSFNTSFSFDRSSIIGNNWGVLLSVKKAGVLSLNKKK